MEGQIYRPIGEQHRVFSTLFHPLHAILVCRRKVVQVLARQIERDELEGLGIIPRIEHQLGSVPQEIGVWRLAVSLSGCDIVLRRAATASFACASVVTPVLMRNIAGTRSFSTDGSSSGRSNAAIAVSSR
jgi:hypothetical protein